MNKIVTAIVTGVTAVAMSACSTGSSEPAVTHTETVTSAPQESQALSNEDAFVQVIRGEFPNLQGSDEDVIAVGHSICGAFDSGRPIDKIADDIVETSGGFNYYDAGFIIGASVPAFCPEHQNKTL